METKTSIQLPRILQLALVAAGLSFAWILLSFVLGLGSSDARADDGSQEGPLGGILGGVVDDTLGGVTGAATETIGAVNSAATAIVASAPLPAPVSDAVAPVAAAASRAVVAAAGTVEDAASGGIAAPVVAAVSAVVVRTPVVGDLAVELGLDDAVGAVGSGFDETVKQVAGSVAGTGAAVGLPDPVGTAPAPGSSSSGAAAAAPGLLADAASLPVSSAEPFAGMAWKAVLRLAGTGSSAAAAFVAASMTAVATSFPLGSLMPADASSAGPGGSGPGAWAILAFGPLVAYRAWVRRRGPADERLPAAPLYATDVSPD